MWLFGYSLDNLSLMALTIAVGFVVDDAIVMLENITRYVEAGRRAAQGCIAWFSRNRVHNRFDQYFTGCRSYSLTADGWHYRPIVSRIRRYSIDDDFRLRVRVVDVNSYDGFALSQISEGSAPWKALRMERTCV